MSIKVIKVTHNGQLVSCRTFEAPFRQNYILKEWIEPPYGPALVFDTIKNALLFSRSTGNSHNDVFFHCKTIDRKPVNVILTAIWSIRTKEALVSIWKHILEYGKIPSHIVYTDPGFKPPKGTYATRKVMLTKRIGVAADLS